MSNINNSQNINIDRSDRVTIRDVNNTVNVNDQSGLNVDEVERIFTLIRRQVDLLPQGTDKQDAEEAVTKIESEAKKGEEAQENVVRRWLNFLLETAPDAWEVAIDTFLHPVKGLSTIFQKIAERAKVEREPGKA